MQATPVIPACAKESPHQRREQPLSLIKAQDLPAETYTIEGTPDLHGLSVVDDRVVWVSGTGGTVARTVDAGASWSRAIVPGAEALDFRSLHAFDKEVACAVSAGSAIYRTADGGHTWQCVLQAETPGIFFNAISFWDARHGIVISDAVGGKFVFYTTDNAGLTWSLFEPQELPPALNGELLFAASNSCLTVHGSSAVWFATGGLPHTPARIFSSHDRGLTWKVSNTPIVSTEQLSGIFSIAFQDARRGIAAGGAARNETSFPGCNIAITQDGGCTWQQDLGYQGMYIPSVIWLSRETAVIVDGSKKNYHALACHKDALWMVGAAGLCAKMLNCRP